MRGFETIRIVVGVFTLLTNSAFGLFLLLDYLRFGPSVHPESYHGPVVLGVFGTAALAIFFIALTAIIELIRRHNPAAFTQVRFELAWIGVVVFLQYSAALLFLALYWFAFDCKVALHSTTCHKANMVVFIASLAIPFITLVYFIFFLVLASRAANRDASGRTWRTPVRDVDWDGRRKTLVFDDSRSIASFSNKEDQMTIKASPNTPYSIGTLRMGGALKIDTSFGGSGLDTTRAANVAAPAAVARSNSNPLRTFTPRPLESIAEGATLDSVSAAPPALLRASPPISNGVRQSVMSEVSVYSTDSAPAPQAPRGGIIPRIIRTSASTLSQQFNSPVRAQVLQTSSPLARSLSKVKYFQATS